MANPHAISIRAAERTTDGLLDLFGKLGTGEHPRGAVLVAYRNAGRALRDVLSGTSWAIPAEVSEVLGGLRQAVDVAVSGALQAASNLGTKQAETELRAYGIGFAHLPTPDLEAARRAILSTVDHQIVTGQAIVSTGGDPTLITGDDSRVGIVTPAPTLGDATRWLAITAALAWMVGVEDTTRQTGIIFNRQAIAALDERTTDCCLQVHGQVVGMNEDFTLTGTPRYADRMRDRPFHDRCRTAICLVRAEDANDELTQQMRQAARAELDARAEIQAHIDSLKQQLADLGEAPDIRIRQGDTEQVKALRIGLRRWKEKRQGEIHPSHARSKR